MSPSPTDAPSPLLALPNTYRAFYGAFATLHPVQRLTIAPLLAGRDIVLQSATGSGKTEAVLAPCIERIIQAGQPASIIYVIPTRALAVDLERRLKTIFCERLGLAIGIRTGDLKRFGQQLPTLLLTTPESLDVAIGSRNRAIQAFLQQTITVIIDEVQPLLSHYRGRQLAYLLARLERRQGRPLQKIALSATLASIPAVKKFFGLRADSAEILEPVQRQIIPHLVHLKDQRRELPGLLNDLYQVWNYRKILLFANSRARCDQLFAQLSQQGMFQHVTELHYSNLKLKERHGAEQRFRQRDHALCIATSTLELGIDVGNIDAVVLFEPPESVSTFLQRIGRANRGTGRTHFWGICQGPSAANQLLRFLALLHLARSGTIELPPPRQLPSVLLQQVLSCQYEKKRLSLAALQSLFPEQAGPLAQLVPNLIRQGWLRPDALPQLLRGGWRYREALLEQRLWSNFPEQEEEYTLLLNDEPLADLPESLVKQLAVGDRLPLAGKPCFIRAIRTGKIKEVLALPADQLDDKDIAWLGPGQLVSFEVAQAMRTTLANGIEPSESGLFKRTQRLWHKVQAETARRVILENGLELSRTVTGFYRYQTYLGSLGNLILQRIMKQRQLLLDLSIEVTTERHESRGAESAEMGYPDAATPIVERDKFIVLADETGLTCSAPVDFQKLNLPHDRASFQEWLSTFLDAGTFPLPLNAYTAFLPTSLQHQEWFDFFYDARVLQAFGRYSRQSSRIVAGAPALLEIPLAEVPAAPDIQPVFPVVPQEPLLAWERRRCHIDSPEPTIPLTAESRPRPLSATLVGEYIRQSQCERWLRLNFIDPRDWPAEWRREDAAGAESFRLEQGRRFESEVLHHLSASGARVHVMPQSEAQVAPLRNRFQASFEQLRQLLGEVKAKPATTVFLAQAVLFQPKLPMSGASGRNEINGEETIDPPSSASWRDDIPGVGIPDLIRIIHNDQGLWCQVGDIKASATAQDHQKWQVAFYAFLLREIFQQECLALPPVRLADSAFLLLPGEAGSTTPYQRLHFSLAPYFAALPMLFRQIQAVLARPWPVATYQLQSACVSCRFFSFCYRQALTSEEIQFLPQLTPGSLEKFRQAGVQTFEAASTLLSPADATASPGPAAIFPPQQRTRLSQGLAALQANTIGRRQERSRLFPVNMSTAIFLTIAVAPESGQPDRIEWLALRQDQVVARFAQDLPTSTPSAAMDLARPGPNEAGRPREPTWLTPFIDLWQESISAGAGPHIFHFGPATWLLFEKLGQNSRLATIFQPNCCFHTDLRRLLAEHFDLPIPGRLTMFALGRVLGLKPELPPPPSLLHPDIPQVSAPAPQDDPTRHRDTIMLSQLWQWCRPHLKSDWRQESFAFEAAGSTLLLPGQQYRQFLEEELRCQEEDIRALDSYTLAERVERFRAIGPLTFRELALDESGQFRYRLQGQPEQGRAKFRVGDFLKLVPAGLDNLQDGFPVILAAFDHDRGLSEVHSRRGRLPLLKGVSYSLEEDLTDWNGPKLSHGLETVFHPTRNHPCVRLLDGQWDTRRDSSEIAWIQAWLTGNSQMTGLNPTQQAALTLPFRHRLSLIEGPPGTGKTHLLGWIIITLLLAARENGRPIRIAISALTHQAIDQVLSKVVRLLQEHYCPPWPAKILKWGRFEEQLPCEASGLTVEALTDADALKSLPQLVLGATGFGLYGLFEGAKGHFPTFFDWIIFDEASQVLVPQALLSLMYGQGNCLFVGDEKQLPPVVLGHYPPGDGKTPAAHHSILSQLLHRYGRDHRLRLDRTYRMNRDICLFPSMMWYDGTLKSDPSCAENRLTLPNFQRADWLDQVLDPAKPVMLLLTNHQGCQQQSDQEVALTAELASRLIRDHGISASRIALISPHRAQNNATADRLARLLGVDSHADLPLIDTVERVQGAERDIIIYACTVSDLDRVASPFINQPHRFNVAITRARQKLIVLGSRRFFGTIPVAEEALGNNRCFKEFYEFCWGRGCLVEVPGKLKESL